MKWILLFYPQVELHEKYENILKIIHHEVTVLIDELITIIVIADLVSFGWHSKYED